MHLPPVIDRFVMVTGCSSGIGLATALYLRDHGWTVYPTARKPADLDALHGKGFSPVELHVDQAESTHRAFEKVLEMSEGRLGGLVNNAAYGLSGALEDLSRDLLREQLETNVLGLQDLTNRAIPVMRRQGYGRIVHVGSILGLVSLPLASAYCASKYALEALADAQRAELAGSGVGLSLVGPGAIQSEFRKHAAARAETLFSETESVFSAVYEREIERRRAQGAGGPKALPPVAVARKIGHALMATRPRPRYTVTREAHLIAFAARVLPKWAVHAIMSYRMQRTFERAKAAQA